MSNRVKTISELLAAIRDTELEGIKPLHEIKHGPLIGEMYEGLTQEIAEKAIFDKFDLRVVSGKIVNDMGDYSDQIDCMIVVGEGESIPFTNKYIYHIDKVIMVIEVKCKLYSSDLSDAWDNLLSVVRLRNDKWSISSKHGIRDAFRLLAANELPDNERYDSLSIRDKMLCHVLVQEDSLPLRIILGYDGFVDVNGLRKAFIKQIQKMIEEGKTNKCAPAFVPNLIISNNSAIVKTNGMPYACILRDSDEIGWLSTYDKSPMLVFLEILWTRLCYKFDINSNAIFGDELQMEAMPLLFSINAKAEGWEYIYRDESFINNVLGNDDVDWEPVRLSIDEAVLMKQLCDNNTVIKADLVKTLGSAEKAEELISKLVFHRFIHVENGEIKLLTREFLCCAVPGYGYLGGDNSDNRFTVWLSKRMSRKKE